MRYIWKSPTIIIVCTKTVPINNNIKRVNEIIKTNRQEIVETLGIQVDESLWRTLWMYPWVCVITIIDWWIQEPSPFASVLRRNKTNISKEMNFSIHNVWCVDYNFSKNAERKMSQTQLSFMQTEWEFFRQNVFKPVIVYLCLG